MSVFHAAGVLAGSSCSSSGGAERARSVPSGAGSSTRAADAPRAELVVAGLLARCAHARSRSSSSTRSTTWATRRSGSGVTLGACARADRRGRDWSSAGASFRARRSRMPTRSRSRPPSRSRSPRSSRRAAARSRRGRLLAVGAGGAGGALGPRWSTPVASLGPVLDTERCARRRGGAACAWSTRRAGRSPPTTCESNAFLTAYPRGRRSRAARRAARRRRARAGQLDLPRTRRAGRPRGIVAYSKICTHAGCAIALYRAPPRADSAAAGTRLPVPLLDVRSGDGRRRSSSAQPGGRCRSCRCASPARRRSRRRQLLAAPVGPSWWGVREGRVIRGPVRALDERSGTAPLLRKALRYVFPDHWSFLLGEIALYAFIVLVATGIYLTLFFDPSRRADRLPRLLRAAAGHEMSQAYTLGRRHLASTSRQAC